MFNVDQDILLENENYDNPKCSIEIIDFQEADLLNLNPEVAQLRNSSRQGAGTETNSKKDEISVLRGNPAPILDALLSASKIGDTRPRIFPDSHRENDAAKIEVFGQTSVFGLNWQKKTVNCPELHV